MLLHRFFTIRPYCTLMLFYRQKLQNPYQPEAGFDPGGIGPSGATLVSQNGGPQNARKSVSRFRSRPPQAIAGCQGLRSQVVVGLPASEPAGLFQSPPACAAWPAGFAVPIDSSSRARRRTTARE